MKTYRLLAITLIASLSLACNLTTLVSQPQATPTDPFPASTLAATNLPAPAASQTPILVPAATSTDAPTVAPTIAVTATPSVPMVTPLKDPVNCRFGPSVNYEQVYPLIVGAFAPVTGKSSDGNWFQVLTPDKQNCWVAASVVVTSGDLSGINTAPVPPSQISDVTFTIKPSSSNLGPGCVGPFPKFALVGTVTVNGPIDIKWHIETQQDGTDSTHTLGFSKYGSQNITYTYVPSSWSKGNYWVRLVITSPSSLTKEVDYQIKCE